MNKASTPKAKKIPHEIQIHGHALVDQYDWLRDRKWPNVTDQDVLDYLKTENQYTKEFFEPLQPVVDKLYHELIGRIKLADRSTPVKHKHHYYFAITEEKSDYAIHARRKKNGVDEIFFDENKEAKGEKFFKVGAISMSPDENLMAYSVDTSGDEHFTIFVRDLSTNKNFTDKITDAIGSIVWSETQSGFYYTKVDDKWRSNMVYWHVLGTDQNQDVLLYKEQDETFGVSLDKTTDDEYIMLCISSKTSTEIRYIDAKDLSHKINMFIERKDDHLCDVDHINGHFYILTNDLGKNFRLVRTKDAEAPHEELIGHSKSAYLIGFLLYDNHLVVESREAGLVQIYVFDYQLKDKEHITFPDPAYSAGAVSSDRDDSGVMIKYNSMVSPSTTFQYNFETRKLETLKVQEIPSGYNKDEYECERIYATSRDGDVEVPVSLVYKKSLFKQDGTNPLFLYGYGSYGHAIPASFSTTRISLLDRGFVYAIAHIRGGDELGFEWYESAKFLTKKRTFHDFIDIAKHLIDKQYTGMAKIVICGGSAGGMLMGVTLNEAPELFKGCVAHVPFVDVLNTMLDDTLPLTPGEFKEWGNPKEEEYFNYMKSYSPYENVKPQHYPHMYVLAGLNDPRVTYWEAAKWVAKLRDVKLDDNTLLLETNMDTGHGGKSGRFEQFKELAKEYAFVLSLFGLK